MDNLVIGFDLMEIRFGIASVFLSENRIGWGGWTTLEVEQFRSIEEAEKFEEKLPNVDKWEGTITEYQAAWRAIAAEMRNDVPSR